MNKLACNCFAIVQCNRICTPGSDLIPTEACKCAPFSDIRALFPKWATRADLQLSIQMGIQEAVPAKPDWQVCPSNLSNRSKCTTNNYWNELACKCFECSSCTGSEKPEDAVFPSWATDEDKRVALESGCKSCPEQIEEVQPIAIEEVEEEEKVVP